MSKMTVGEKIAYARKKRGISQSDLSEMMEIDRQQISRWETGTRNPKKDTLEKISEILRIHDGYFIDSKDDDSFDPDSHFIPLDKNATLFDPENVKTPTRKDYVQFLLDYIKFLSEDELKETVLFVVNLVIKK